MKADFLIFPDAQIFELVIMTWNLNQGKENSAFDIFKWSFNYFLDTREKVVMISEDLYEELKSGSFRNGWENRKDFFHTIIDVEGKYDCSPDKSLLRLALLKSIETDKKIYYVTDNAKMREIINGSYNLEAVSSDKMKQVLTSNKSEN